MWTRGQYNSFTSGSSEGKLSSQEGFVYLHGSCSSYIQVSCYTIYNSYNQLRISAFKCLYKMLEMQMHLTNLQICVS